MRFNVTFKTYKQQVCYRCRNLSRGRYDARNVYYASAYQEEIHFQL